MELNREQIKKALECCTKGACVSCPHFEKTLCQIPLTYESLALINELTAELDEQKARNIELANMVANAHNDIVRNTAEKMQFLMTLRYGTYVDTDTIKLADLFKALDEVAAKVEEGL